MTHRTDRVYLAPDEPRCSPQHECHLKHRCARYMAALPPSHAQMIGADLPPTWHGGDWCHRFVPASRPGAAAPTPKAVKPPVKGIA